MDAVAAEPSLVPTMIWSQRKTCRFKRAPVRLLSNEICSSNDEQILERRKVSRYAKCIENETWPLLEVEGTFHCPPDGHWLI